MGQGFFKGEKKKPKKGKDKGVMSTATSSAPIFTLPKLIEKKKNYQ